MKVYGELKFAQLENVASDPATGLALGRMIINTTSNLVKFWNGSAWIILSSTVAGGVGNSLIWTNEGPDAALMSIENNQRVYLFAQSLSQKLYTVLRVPLNYTVGNQIKAYVLAYSPSTSNQFLLAATSVLIRTGTDAMTSTALSRLSTNSLLTNTVANQVRQITLDLTDTTGKIGGTSVSAGDMIKITLTRSGDTDISDIRLLDVPSEVAYS